MYYNLRAFLNFSDEQRQNLSTLNLIDCKLNELNDEEFRQFCQKISQCKNIEEFTLLRSKLDLLNLPRLKKLRGALSNCTNVKKLNLSGNNLNSFSGDPNDANLKKFSEICTIISQCEKLQELQLRFNNIGDFDLPHLKMLSEAISKRKETLEILDLISNHVGKLELAEFKEFCNIFPQDGKLKKVDLSSNDLGALDESGLKILRDGLSNCKDLTTLNLISNRFGDLNKENLSRFVIFCRAIFQLEHMKELDLRLNMLGKLDESRFAIFCKHISQYKRWLKINLENNDIDPKKMELINNILIENKGLSHLPGDPGKQPAGGGGNKGKPSTLLFAAGVVVTKQGKNIKGGPQLITDLEEHIKKAQEAMGKDKDGKPKNR